MEISDISDMSAESSILTREHRCSSCTNTHESYMPLLLKAYVTFCLCSIYLYIVKVAVLLLDDSTSKKGVRDRRLWVLKVTNQRRGATVYSIPASNGSKVTDTVLCTRITRALLVFMCLGFCLGTN